jgi:hypothetical protein
MWQLCAAWRRTGQNSVRVRSGLPRAILLRGLEGRRSSTTRVSHALELGSSIACFPVVSDEYGAASHMIAGCC